MRITVVIVLYNQRIDECRTILTFTEALQKQKSFQHELDIIFYDNSPKKQAFDPNDYPGVSIDYKHDPRNLGIATAYNYALQHAKDNGSQWLLLLDHDTEITEDYLKQLNQLDKYEVDIAAVVPIITYENTVISPTLSNTHRPLMAERPEAGIQNSPVMAFNSGALIRIAFLEKIGGFNKSFPLDYLDHWLFYEIYAKGHRVYIMNTALEHELSVMDYSRVSLKRYKSILESEILFYTKYKKELLPSYKMQLMKRLLKQIVLVKNKKIAAYTLKRLFTLN